MVYDLKQLRREYIEKRSEYLVATGRDPDDEALELLDEEEEEEEDDLAFGEKRPEMSFEAELAERRDKEGDLAPDELHRRGKACQMERKY